MKFILMHEYGVEQEAEIRISGEKHNRYDYAIFKIMDLLDFKYYHDIEHDRILLWHTDWERICDRVSEVVESYNNGEPSYFDTCFPKGEYLMAPSTVYGEYVYTGIE